MKRFLRCRLTLATFVLGAVLAAVDQAHALQGEAFVAVSIDAPFFGQLPIEAREAVEIRLAGSIVESAADQYPFLDWSIDGGRGPELTVRLAEDPNTGGVSGCPPKMDLRFYRWIGQGDTEPLREVLPVTVFETCSLISANDTTGLRSRAEVVLDSVFRDAGFRRGLEAGFVNLVPFADDVEPLETQATEVPKVRLPVPCRRAWFGDATRLAVQFVHRRPTDGRELDGWLYLGDPFQSEMGTAFELEVKRHTADAPSLFAAARAGGDLVALHVFMQEYHRAEFCDRPSPIP